MAKCSNIYTDQGSAYQLQKSNTRMKEKINNMYISTTTNLIHHYAVMSPEMQLITHWLNMDVHCRKQSKSMLDKMPLKSRQCLKYVCD